VLGGAVELAMNLAVTHLNLPSFLCRDGSSLQVGFLRSP
jgi:hypothetical protein